MDNMVKGMDSWPILVESLEAEKLAGTAFDRIDDEIEKVYLNVEF